MPLFIYLFIYVGYSFWSGNDSLNYRHMVKKKTNCTKSEIGCKCISCWLYYYRQMNADTLICIWKQKQCYFYRVKSRNISFSPLKQWLKWLWNNRTLLVIMILLSLWVTIDFSDVSLVCWPRRLGALSCSKYSICLLSLTLRPPT